MFVATYFALLASQLYLTFSMTEENANRNLVGTALVVIATVVLCKMM